MTDQNFPPEQAPDQSKSDPPPIRQAPKRVRRPAAQRRPLDAWAIRIGNGLISASLVFAAFALYAFLAPASYRSSALVWLALERDKPAPQLLEPQASAQKLRGALLDADFLQQLSKDIAPASIAERDRVIRQLAASIEVSTADGRSFGLSFSDPDRFRAQRITAALSRRALERLPALVVAPAEAERVGEDERQKRVAALMKFMAEHPEVTASAKPQASATAPSTKPNPWNDPALATLLRERARVQKRLDELSGPAGMAWSDNPYDEPEMWTNPTKLRRRLVEIDRTLEARRRAMSHAEMEREKKSEIAPELLSEWKHLLDAVTQAPAEPAAKPKTAALEARLATPADLPRWPLKPARLLLLWLGGAFGTAFGMAIALRGRRRSSPSLRSRTPWPNLSRAVSHRPPPLIARSLPPRAREHSASPLPLALVRPRANAALPAAHSDGGFGQMIPITRSSPQRSSAPAPTSARQSQAPPSRPRHTLMFGTVEGAMDQVLQSVSEERAVAIKLRFQESSAHERRGTSEPAPSVLAKPLRDRFMPHAALSLASRRSIASELLPLAMEAPLVIAVAGSPAELKSKVAAELALALAELAQGRVLLLEGNFGRPALHHWLNVQMPRSFGFSRQLQARSLGRLQGWNVLRCSEWLDVLIEGALRAPGGPDSEQLLRSVHELSRHYAIVVIDAPPLEAAADCRSVDAACDALVVVHGRERAAELSRAAALFGKKRFSTSIECG